MWALVVLLLVCGSSNSDAKIVVRCSEKNESSVSVEDTPTAARYEVTYCTASQPAPLYWELLLSVVNEPADNCSYDQLGEGRAGVSHSHSMEDINPTLNISCPYVCFSKKMDLMFRSCYRLENKLRRKGPHQPINSEPFNTYYYADNNSTQFTKDNLQYIKCIDYDDVVVCTWFEGLIPITDYEVSMWPNSTHFTEDATDVTNNCSLAASSVRCVLLVPPGCYVLQLRHTAPWVKGYHSLAVHNADLCYSTPSPDRVAVPAPTDAGLYWLVGGLAALAASLLAGLLAYRRRLHAKAQLRVVRGWLHRSPPASPLSEGAGPVLLLYARDCARVAAALREWMQAVAPGKVYDVYSAEVVRAAAASPAAWVRGCMSAPDVRVVLLQSPALAALHAVTLADCRDRLRLEEPLLPRRAAYRRPHYGDALLQYAAQLLGETAHTQPAPPYKKYFLATVSELPVDVFPALVPYTRFELPAAAPALLHSLWPLPRPCEPAAPAAPTSPPAPPVHLEALSDAVTELVQFVRDNPDYLADELIFV